MSLSKRVITRISILMLGMLLFTQQQQVIAGQVGTASAPATTRIYDKIIQEYTVIWNALAYIMPPVSNITVEESTAGSHLSPYHYSSKHTPNIHRAHSTICGNIHYYRLTVSFFKSQFKTSYYYYVYFLRKIII